MDIANKILEQIAHHRAEILRLESALQVIMEMGGGGKSAKGQQPMITIRKITPEAQAQIEPPKKAPSQAPRKTGTDRLRDIEAKKRLRENVLDALSRGPMSTKAMIARFGPKKPNAADKQVFYALMYDLHQAGLVHREKNGQERIFSLVQQPQQMATAS